ncbi:hypothetical protein EX30DRAFT_339981 [Ascodesmis nigricans]|uniref:Uncharacterized protein n=1 Tax=Ascodesmis nigricans TaxID=341454 RepID=A0A4S2MZD9_9PEZI|nr:hypothetical protein EX30DRAFT_339981 [Ascodesmis nigricans]
MMLFQTHLSQQLSSYLPSLATLLYQYRYSFIIAQNNLPPHLHTQSPPHRNTLHHFSLTTYNPTPIHKPLNDQSVPTLPTGSPSTPQLINRITRHHPTTTTPSTMLLPPPQCTRIENPHHPNHGIEHNPLPSSSTSLRFSSHLFSNPEK